MIHLPSSSLAGGAMISANRTFLSIRSDGNEEATDVAFQYSIRERSILHIITISAAALSVSATIISLYWLFRMKQVFRHR